MKPAEKKKPNGSRPVTPPRNMVTKQAKKWSGGGVTNVGSLTLLFCFRLSHLKDWLFFMLPILKRYPLLPDESKIFCCFVHRGKLICHHENLRCFALHFAASLCHIWLFNQEKCNNTATYAQECLVWSCAQFFQFLSCVIHLSSFFSLSIMGINGYKTNGGKSHKHLFTYVKLYLQLIYSQCRRTLTPHSASSHF